MATYGDGPGGEITLYDGESDNDPTIHEIVRAIYDFLGLQGGTARPDLPWLPRFLEDYYGHRIPTAVETAAHLKASMDFFGGEFLSPSGWADYGLEIGDWWRALHASTTGTREMDRPSGGGGAWLGDYREPLVLVDGVLQAAAPAELSPYAEASLVEAIWLRAFPTYNLELGPVYFPASQLLADTRRILQFALTYGGMAIPGRSHIRVVASDLGEAQAVLGDYTWPGYSTLPASVEPAEAVGDETLAEYLARTQPARTWAATAPFVWLASDYLWSSEPTDYGMWYFCDIARAQWASLVAQSRPVLVAPVWPGAARVTLGDTISGATTGRFDVACDGVILSITAHRAGQGHQQAGDVALWQHSGWIAFLDDAGGAEPLQWLGLDTIQYLPHDMTRAAGWVLWTSPGVTVAITPWDID